MGLYCTDCWGSPIPSPDHLLSPSSVELEQDLWLPQIKTAFPHHCCSWRRHTKFRMHRCHAVAARNLTLFFALLSFLLPGIWLPPAWTMRLRDRAACGKMCRSLTIEVLFPPHPSHGPNMKEKSSSVSFPVTCCPA